MPGCSLRVVALALFLPWTTGTAQRADPAIDVSIPSDSALVRSGPTVRFSHVMSDSSTRELLEAGFPTRLRARLELWADGRFLDDMLGRTEWELVVSFDPMARSYRVLRRTGPDRIRLLGVFARFADAVAEVERGTSVPLLPQARQSRQYYQATLEVQTLSLSDLEELQRWLKGDLSPAVRGDENLGSVLTRGARSVVAQLLGQETRHLQARSRTFQIKPEPARN